MADYFDDCTTNKTHPNKASLALFLGVTRETLHKYETGTYDDEHNKYSDTIKRGYLQIESHWVNVLGRPAPAVGAIFYLKNALGYRDVVENPGGGTTINFVLPAEIAAKYQIVEPIPPAPLPPEDVKVVEEPPKEEPAQEHA